MIAPRSTPTILMLDAKHFRIQRRPWTLYVAIDGQTGYPLAWALLPRHELRFGYDLLLGALKRALPVINAVVSDWHWTILASVHEHLPSVIHQRCAAHVLRDVYRVLGGRWWHRTLRGQRWPIFRRIALRFPSEETARRYLERMARSYPEHRKAFKVLRESLTDIYQFGRRPNLVIPRTSNRIENLMGRITQRLKTMRGVKTDQTLRRYLTYLIVG